jgi:hypothetical protein
MTDETRKGMVAATVYWPKKLSLSHKTRDKGEPGIDTAEPSETQKEHSHLAISIHNVSSTRSEQE